MDYQENGIVDIQIEILEKTNIFFYSSKCVIAFICKLLYACYIPSVRPSCQLCDISKQIYGLL